MGVWQNWITEADDDYDNEASTMSKMLIEMKLGTPQKLIRKYDQRGGEETINFLIKHGFTQDQAEDIVEMIKTQKSNDIEI